MGHNKNHSTEHIDGTDDIQDATATQKGLATAAQISKLDGIEAGADVTGSNPPQAHTHVEADITNLRAFGTERQGFESESESTTTSASLQDKINQNTTSLPAGTYIFNYSAEIFTDAWTNRKCEAVVEIDGTAYALMENSPAILSISAELTLHYTRMITPLSGFKVLTLTAGVKNIKMQFRRSGTGGTAYIRRARIHLWRVA